MPRSDGSSAGLKPKSAQGARLLDKQRSEGNSSEVATKDEKAVNKISFVTQRAPVDERGRALYAVTRSVLRALIDQLSLLQLTVLNTEPGDVTMRQLAFASRLQRDKGMRGDGFEWAVHEAIVGGEPRVVEYLVDAMRRASPRSFGSLENPMSLLFGHERAKYLGFLDAVVETAAAEAVILPDGRGHPARFDNWVRVAAKGEVSEGELVPRLRKVWQTDLFVSDEERHRHVAVTVKSNKEALSGGPGLRIGIVPQHLALPPGVTRQFTKGGDPLWVVTLPDPDGFMGIYNDAYGAVAEAITTLGQHDHTKHWAKPSPVAQQIEKQLVGYADVRVVDIVDALDDAAQQDLTDVDTHLISVAAPEWLTLGAPDASATALAPKPSFIKLD